MKSILWEREGGESPTELEGSVMTEKGDNSQTCLIDVFNCSRFAEPPGNVPRKGLLEVVVQVHEGVRLEVMLVHPPTPSSGPNTSPPCQEDGGHAGSSFPAAQRSISAHSAGLFPARRCWSLVGGTGEVWVQACPWVAVPWEQAEKTPPQRDWPQGHHLNY